jgi:hypothetical protein
MSGFLSGKTASYSRLMTDLPDLRKIIDEKMGEGILPLAGSDDNRTEAIGSCSFRNLLDGPIDRGLVDGDPDIWCCGVRKDVKKAPASLVRAETARAISDYMQTCGGAPSRKAIAKIKFEVRRSLDLASQPKPSAGILAANLESGFLLLDGPTGSQGWVAGRLTARSVYDAEAGYSDFLQWLIWSGLNPDDSDQAMAWPVGDVTFLDGEGDGAKYIGSNDLSGLLDAWKGKATIRKARFAFVVGDLVSEVELDAAALKVSGLVFPEEIAKAPTPSLEARLHARLKYLFTFETTLAGLAANWATRGLNNDWPEAYLQLITQE